MGDVFYDWLSCKDSYVSLIIIGNGIFLTIRRSKQFIKRDHFWVRFFFDNLFYIFSME